MSPARPRRPAGHRAARSSTAPPLVLAMAKGRILEQAVELFGRAGYDLGAAIGRSRRLVHDCGPLRVLIVRGGDVPTYVEHGVADLGVTGRDVLDEEGLDLYEPLDLGIGRCRLVVAEAVARPVDVRAPIHLRIATKYPALTRRYLERSGQTAEIIELSGSVELGALTGLADRIVDLTETGETLRQNGLVEVETILEVTARLVVNPARFKLRAEAVADVIGRLAGQL
jgi:ATP phosphoribosyltransferase